MTVRVNGGHRQNRPKVIELTNKLDINVHTRRLKSRKFWQTVLSKIRPRESSRA
jgi:hypothetical protein